MYLLKKVFFTPIDESQNPVGQKKKNLGTNEYTLYSFIHRAREQWAAGLLSSCDFGKRMSELTSEMEMSISCST